MVSVIRMKVGDLPPNTIFLFQNGKWYTTLAETVGMSAGIIHGFRAVQDLSGNLEFAYEDMDATVIDVGDEWKMGILKSWLFSVN